MFTRLIHFFISAKLRRQTHAAAWSDSLVADEQNLTQFQRIARTELELALGQLPLEIKGDKERYLIGLLPGTDTTVFLYADGAEVNGGPAPFRAERWDYDTPAAFISDFVASAVSAAQSNNSFKPNPLRGSA